MLRAAMAEARNAAEVRFRLVFDNAVSAVGIGDADGRVVDLDPAMATMLGIPREYLFEHEVAEQIHPDDRAELRRRVRGDLHAAGTGRARTELRYPQPGASMAGPPRRSP